jgi:tRNA methyl transferase
MGMKHPMLFHHSLTVRADKMSWVAGRPPAGIVDQLAALTQGNQTAALTQGNQTEDSTGMSRPNCSDFSTAPGSIINSSSSSSSSSCSTSASSPLPISRRDSAGGLIGFRCGFKARYLQGIELCTVTVRLLSPNTVSSPLAGAGVSAGVTSQRNTPAESTVSSADYSMLNPQPHLLSYDLVVTFDEPHRAITPGQILALYAGDECLGGGIISVSDAPVVAQIDSD